MEPTSGTVNNKLAVAIYMGFSNALHTAMHKEQISGDDVMAILLQAQKDMQTLMLGEDLPIDFHEGSTMKLDSEQAVFQEQLLLHVVQLGAAMKNPVDQAGQQIKPTVVPEKQTVN